jgi:hypothetical protein
MCHLQLQATQPVLHKHSLNAPLLCAACCYASLHRNCWQLLPGLMLLVNATRELSPEPQLQLALLLHCCQQCQAIVLHKHLLPCAVLLQSICGTSANARP